MPIPIDDDMLDDARRLNARLARMPRFGMPSPGRCGAAGPALA